jgi:hypothetical protein
MSKVKNYFNYPICLHKDLFFSPFDALNNMFDFAIVAYAESLNGSKKERINYTIKHFGVTIGDIERTYQNGLVLQHYKRPMPFVGINKEVWFDYYKNIDDKTEYQIALLAAHQAIKSILGQKAATKTNKRMIVARMFGFTSPKEIKEPSELMQKYSQRYWMDKLITDLELNWNLKTFSNHLRGMYVSYDLDYKEIARISEASKQSAKVKNLKALKKQALQAVTDNVTDNYLSVTDTS